MWGSEILFLPLHPCTVVLSGFPQSTTIASQILHRVFHFFSSCRVCGEEQASVIGPVLSTLYRKDHLVVSCPNVHLPVLLHLFSVWFSLSLPGALPSEVFLSEGTRGRSTSPETAACTDASLRSLCLRRNKSQLIFKLEAMYRTRR